MAFFDPLLDNMAPQLVSSDETAAQLALAVQKLLCGGVERLPFFDSQTPLDSSAGVILTDIFGAVNDQKVTHENIMDIAAEVPHYFFTFKMADGEAVVTSFTSIKENSA